MRIDFKKYRKFILLAVLLVVLVGCKSVIDPDTRQVMDQYVIRLGDKFPWGKEGYGWFSIFIIWPISQLFNLVASKTGAFWSIIIVTLLIDLVKFRSTIKSTVSQQKITALQPELNRINEKYKGRDDRQSQMQKAAEMQKLYEKNDVSMFGSMAPMLLQFPIIIAVYQAVQRAELIIKGEIMGHAFLGTPKEGLASGNYIYVIIFAIMVVSQAASMFVPQYLQKRKMKVRPTQTEGPNPQTMMMVSLGMISLLAFSWNIGMSIYWAISAIFRLIQTLFIQWKYVDKK